MDSTRRIGVYLSQVALIAVAWINGPGALAAEPVSPTAAEEPATQTPTGAPNVLVWMIDDLGFGQLGCFGGLVATPNLDALARDGLRYTNYHTTPICSASRAAFLTGRNSHNVHVGSHAALSLPHPGYDVRIPASAGTVASYLHDRGYMTFALGKWDHMPSQDMSAAGPFTYWPSGQGFDRFYGFLAADADNYHPQLWSDHRAVKLPNEVSYHLTQDLADRAIEFVAARNATAPRRPFFMYWATGAVHAPHHAPLAHRQRYRGKFDAGWDSAREKILQNQIRMGIFPSDTKLAPRPEGMPAWNSLTPDQKRMYARQMEVFAAQLTHADEQFGRILDGLRRSGELENTIVIVTSDNGASAEGAIDGSYNAGLFVSGRFPDVAQNLKYYDAWGDETNYPHYSYGWAAAGNTPLRYYKQTTYEGGTRVPLIVSWPKGIGSQGELRTQYHHVSDITPTILEAARVEPPTHLDGVAQKPFDGISMTYSFKAAVAPSPKAIQYYEMFGNTALWANGWKAVNPHRLRAWEIGGDPPFVDKWQLYDLTKDPSEMLDLAARHPDRLTQLVSLFDKEAKQYNVYPLTNSGVGIRAMKQRSQEEFGLRSGRWHYPNPVSRVPVGRAPPILQRSYTMTAELDLRSSMASAPIIAFGGAHGGVALYLRDGRPVFAYRDGDLSLWKVEGQTALPRGRVELEMSFERRESDAVVRIRANGTDLASGNIPHPIGGTVPGADSFGIGIDSGSRVASDYTGETGTDVEIRDVRFDFNR